jgi:geranylgeranyl diphosphate synthase type I
MTARGASMTRPDGSVAEGPVSDAPASDALDLAGSGPADDLSVGIEADLPAAVTADLAEYLAGRRADCADISEDFALAADDLVRFVLSGGKRLRPVFGWWGWRAAGGTEGADAVLRAVGALELIQACALVHDDLIDDSATRRGEPTVHARWAAAHRDGSWAGDPARFGAAVAILLGDIALAWADDRLHTAGLPPEALVRARPVWQAMRTEVLGGQFLDVAGHAWSDSRPETALRISRYKTAAYTVERPLHLGAAIAGAGPALVNAYRRFGADIGVAFQLRDDLLGMFGDPQVTGKPAGDDLREGKRTLLLAYALRAADEKRQSGAADLLRGAIGDPQVDENTVTEVRELLIQLGAVAEVERRITTLTTSALGSLRAADLAEPAGVQLRELAAQATCRVR